MARCGFYEIKTFETLTREYLIHDYSYDLIVKKEQKNANEQSDGEQEDGKDKNKRTRKQRDKKMLVAAPKTDQRGHTGFLTFAIKF